MFRGQYCGSGDVYGLYAESPTHPNPVQETFYLHQLTVNIFNIHNIANDKTMFCLS